MHSMRERISFMPARFGRWTQSREPPASWLTPYGAPYPRLVLSLLACCWMVKRWSYSVEFLNWHSPSTHWVWELGTCFRLAFIVLPLFYVVSFIVLCFRYAASHFLAGRWIQKAARKSGKAINTQLNLHYISFCRISSWWLAFLIFDALLVSIISQLYQFFNTL